MIDAWTKKCNPNGLTNMTVSKEFWIKKISIDFQSVNFNFLYYYIVCYFSKISYSFNTINNKNGLQAYTYYCCHKRVTNKSDLAPITSKIKVEIDSYLPFRTKFQVKRRKRKLQLKIKINICLADRSVLLSYGWQSI